MVLRLSRRNERRKRGRLSLGCPRGRADDDQDWDEKILCGHVAPCGACPALLRNLHQRLCLGGVASPGVGWRGGGVHRGRRAGVSPGLGRGGDGRARPAAGTVLAVYFGGGGLGILLSGLGVPVLLALGPASAWRWASTGLGAASLLALAPATWVVLGLQEPPKGLAETPGAGRPWRFGQLSCPIFCSVLVIYRT